MQPFPDDVRRFLDRAIESVDQLEILRLLGEEPGREWSAGELAAAVQTSTAATVGHLTALHGRGLLHAEARGPDTFSRHGPAADRAEILGRLLQAYRERPVSMIKYVYARANDPLRTFADAFRLRRPEGG